MAFNGITNLRDANESVRVLPWQLKELEKCAKDPIYFIRNYVYINTKDKGMQLFGLYDFQEELLIKFNENRFNIVKFPRQCGKCIFPDEIIYIMNEDGEEMKFTIEEFFNLLGELDE
jgi:hypothetical protein